MPVWLQFLSEPRFILWAIFVFGVFNILTATIYYSRAMAMARNLYEFATERAIREERPLVVTLLGICERMLNKKWLRICGIFEGLFFIALSLAALTAL